MNTLAVASCNDCPMCWQDVDVYPEGIGAWCQHPGFPEHKKVTDPSQIPGWCPLRTASLHLITVTIEEADDG